MFFFVKLGQLSFSAVGSAGGGDFGGKFDASVVKISRVLESYREGAEFW